MNRETKYFCVGLGVGIAGTFLCAPKSGAEVRKGIQEKANQSASYLKEQAEGAANTVADVVDRGARTVRHHKENLMAAVEAGTQAYREAVSSMPASDFKV